MDQRTARSFHAVFWRDAIAVAFAVVVFAWPMLTLTGLLVLFAAFGLIDATASLVFAMRTRVS